MCGTVPPPGSPIASASFTLTLTPWPMRIQAHNTGPCPAAIRMMALPVCRCWQEHPSGFARSCVLCWLLVVPWSIHGGGVLSGSFSVLGLLWITRPAPWPEGPMPQAACYCMLAFSWFIKPGNGMSCSWAAGRPRIIRARALFAARVRLAHGHLPRALRPGQGSRPGMSSAGRVVPCLPRSLKHEPRRRVRHSTAEHMHSAHATHTHTQHNMPLRSYCLIPTLLLFVVWRIWFVKHMPHGEHADRPVCRFCSRRIVVHIYRDGSGMAWAYRQRRAQFGSNHSSRSFVAA